ncbi:MAG: AraC family transcriptional regulator [Roseibium sp.]|uniref:AraC family transcriptional regulator n=1 Tax=Roseibium sp. TaxID=1936156 RepID=UPI001B05F27C|nr:AraC family transcriptional regulator [Roseibium sp.]MBO6890884.1 AraC family transcriptional regulator [Roseibium sp.]MBO6932358.1 AraC family transcriptional regulator [Roseibium sp.]
MSKQKIKQVIDRQLPTAGMAGIGVKGVQLFRVTEPVACAPAVYEPTVVAIVSGTKEAILDGNRHVYDSRRYLCCPMSMPVEAGTPAASPENPLLGVLISLDTRVLSEMNLEMERAGGPLRKPAKEPYSAGLTLAQWDTDFSEALLRLVELAKEPVDAAVLGEGRLREFYYAVLKGEAGSSVRQAFGVGNEIARTIEYLSARLHEPVSIDEMAAHAGMSRAVFHRKFKQATTMSPIQFAKSMRLNQAAMKIAGGMNVSEAAWHVGYVSTSQFSREFKRMYGETPKRWSQATQLPAGVM